MAVAGRTMRRCRGRSGSPSARPRKRGALIEFVTIDWHEESGQPAAADSMDLLALDQALEALELRDAVAARVVELRYFSGLNNDEVAEVIGVSVATIVRHWRFGRALAAQRRL